MGVRLVEVAEITNSSGTVRIAAHVIAKIAGRIALSVPGVIGMDSDLSDTISQAIGMECTNGVHVSCLLYTSTAAGRYYGGFLCR